MRKLLLFIFFSGIIISNSFGQDIQIFNDQNVIIPNNAVIQIYGNPTDEQLKATLWVKNSALADLSLSVNKEVVSESEGSNNAFFWDSYVEQNESPAYALFLTPNELNKGFSALYSPNLNRGLCRVKYTFYDINNPHISASVVIEFITNNAQNPLIGNSEISLSDAYPNPAESMVYFDYTLQDQIFEAKIIVRTLLGSIVSEANLEGNQGKASINVDDLIEGIYFYSLVVDSHIKFTKKLIIKH